MKNLREQFPKRKYFAEHEQDWELLCFLPARFLKKKRFVEHELAQLLKAANSKIINVTYGIKDDADETVYVTMENGCGYEIDVSADSLMAIAKDVTNTMMYK